jgi:hypothetical protein
MALGNSMRIRGLVKLISLIIVCNQVLTAAFSYACRTIDPTVTPIVISGFGLISSLMISYWLQSDARRAYHHASEKKLVKGVDASHPLPMIDDQCPRKWLVMLHIELNPVLVGL